MSYYRSGSLPYIRDQRPMRRCLVSVSFPPHELRAADLDVVSLNSPNSWTQNTLCSSPYEITAQEVAWHHSSDIRPIRPASITTYVTRARHANIQPIDPPSAHDRTRDEHALYIT
jgi:hypothetical protein